MKSKSVGWDFVGRIRNISLAPSPANSLLPVFEGITNSIQAIEERFGAENLSLGRIAVEVLRDDQGDVTGFIVDDNGVGLNQENMGSFETSDSRYKSARGGKGIGRFVWLKVFEKVHVDSRYGDAPTDGLSFDFALTEKDQIANISERAARPKRGTTVRLNPFRSEYKSVCPKRAETIQAKIISHFLSYFISGNTPEITVVDGEESRLSTEFADYVQGRKDSEIVVQVGNDSLTFQYSCLLLPKSLSDDEKGTNAIFYGANGRAVVRRAIDNAIGMQAIEGSNAFFGYVTGTYLDRHVNQERTAISWGDEDVAAEVHSQALTLTKEFLSPQIVKIRTKQTEVVSKLLGENLRFITIVSDPAEFAASLELGTQSAEDIYLELSREARREENRTRLEYSQAKKKKADIDEDVKKYTAKLSKESLASLAEYVYKRKLILNAFEDKLAFSDVESKRHELEEVVHDLIVPLRSTFDDMRYEDHNLWIVDDQLAFYSYFNSDKTLRAITGGADASTKEPDLTLFDLGLGMERSGSLEPISIIEFKRPGRSNYTLSDNPIVQIREYCSRLRSAGRLVNAKGKELRAIEENTPFQGHIIADITPSLIEMMKQFGPYAKKAGHSCYYKWDDEYKMFIQIQSYSDVLKGARARNEAFFQHLGVNL